MGFSELHNECETLLEDAKHVLEASVLASDLGDYASQRVLELSLTAVHDRAAKLLVLLKYRDRPRAS